MEDNKNIVSDPELEPVVGGAAEEVEFPHKYSVGMSFYKYENCVHYYFTIGKLSTVTGELKYVGEYKEVNNISKYTYCVNSERFTEPELDAKFPNGPTV